MKNLFIAALLLTWNVETAWAQEPVTRVVMRTQQLEKDGSTFERPRSTMTRSGSAFLRIEEDYDPHDDVKMVIIRAKRDVWQIDLRHKKGQHVVYDTSTARISLVARDGIADLESGREMEFMEQNHARNLGQQKLGEHTYEALEVKREGYKVDLYMMPKTATPAVLEVLDGNERLILRCIYENYQKNLPFDSTLFQPPAGVKIQESKAP